ncbi:DUF4257 domain-containing protein [Bacillus sp. REN16]|uniref:DUF4257 domain-containing protein n=1 Tax=Bacillus sp. REN16 TaxID=2887296 RepID=UPI001E5675E6|nr:DUF4257 domain-containing protein [Bacillus sp. REN16]MCC3358633.1 DUF4257 domain-containing protein [Bacillus sp. REN16]
MLLHLMLAIFIGGSMGLLGHAKKQGKIEKPRVTKRFIYLGFLEEMIIGTVAAVLVVASSDTESIFRVVFLSILAGYGGERIMQRVDLVRQVNTSSESPPQTNQEQENNKTNDAI